MIGPTGEDAIALEEWPRVIDGPWGYACIEQDAVYIPAVVASQEWPLRRVLAHLHEQSGLTRMVFSAVLDAESLKSHLRNIVREWDEFVPEMGDTSHCIEVRYEAVSSASAAPSSES